MDIKERLLQEEIKRAQQAPNTKRQQRYPPKTHMAILCLIIIGLLARMEMTEQQNEQLRHQVNLLQSTSKTITPSLMPASFDPYTVLDDSPLCESRYTITLGGKKSCLPI